MRTSELTYVGSKTKLICRDGNEQYARSMDLKFKTYDFLSTNPDKVIIDVSAGWTDEVGMRFIYAYVTNHVGPIYIRLVDQYDHQKSSNAYSTLLDLYSRYSYKMKIIGTYQADYYGMKVDLVLPYPYLDEERLVSYEPGSFNTRLNKLILSGSDIESIYPMRCKLYRISENSKYIDKLSHPGYSGRHWNEGKVGDSYLGHLAQYKFMICTTCNERYELLKYIECAEVGCICVGEVPLGLEGTEAERWIVKIPEFKDSAEFDEWVESYLMKLNLDDYSINYNRVISELRDKNKLIRKLHEFTETWEI